MNNTFSAGGDRANMEKVADFFPERNRSYVLVGASGTGKTTWAVNLINQFLANGEKFSSCMIFYEVYQKLYDQINMEINAFEGMQELLSLPDEKYTNSIVVLDDQQLQIRGDYLKAINRLFTVIAHHKQCTVIILLQNLFSDDSQLKTIYKNASYLTVFNSRQTMQLLTSLQRLFFVGAQGQLKAAAEHAFKYHNYIMLDMITHSSFPIKTGVLNDNPSFAYKITHVCFVSN